MPSFPSVLRIGGQCARGCAQHLSDQSFARLSLVPKVTFRHAAVGASHLGLASSIPTSGPTFGHALPRVSCGWQAVRRLSAGSFSEGGHYFLGRQSRRRHGVTRSAQTGRHRPTFSETGNCPASRFRASALPLRRRRRAVSPSGCTARFLMFSIGMPTFSGWPPAVGNFLGPW